MKVWSFAGLTLALMLSACSEQSTSESLSADGVEGYSNQPSATESRLAVVQQRGKLICGVDGGIPGFSFVDDDGAYSGLDVEVCQALAAALFDDPEAVEYRRLESSERFVALAQGEVDILSRNTTWTVKRDTQLGIEFGPTIFYDGQGVMVRKDSGITEIEDFSGKRICVETQTTTEANLADSLQELKISAEVLFYQDTDVVYDSYQQGRCEGVTADKSQLIVSRSQFNNPDDHTLLNVTMSKEPLGPVIVDNDSAWFDVVEWVIYGLMQAEEFGITSANVDDFKDSQDASVEIARFLGDEDTFGSDMGISDNFMYRVISHVGNYGEIYDRNLGSESQFQLDRGLNNLWINGGLLYSPPFR
ncbi:MAG: amino acid ABC transporter substrate-binding protein [Leptolyngbyaceae cyanobacterium]